MRLQRVMVAVVMVVATAVVLPSGTGAEVSDFCEGLSGWPVLVCDDFSSEDPLDAYRLENPRPAPGHSPMQISIVDEALAFQHLSGFGVAAAFRTEGVQLRDTTFEADVTLSSSSSAIAGIEWESDLQNRFQFWIGKNRANLDLSDNGSWTISQGLGFGIVPGQTYRLGLEVIDNTRLVASIDGEVVIDVTYDLSFMPEAAFPGFVTNSYGPSGTFDDVTVVAHNAPPVSDANGPYQGFEGTAIGLDGTGSSDPNGNPLTYAWTVDSPLCSFDDPASASPELTCSDDGDFEVGLIVDDGHLTDSSTAPVAVSNVAPLVTIDSYPSGLVTTADPVTVGFSFTDPGTADTHEAECAAHGAAEVLTGVVSPASCTLELGAGMQTVTVTVTDDDGAAGTDEVDILVTQLADLKTRPRVITLEWDDDGWEVDGRDRIRVFVYSTPEFDATSVDPATAALGDPALPGVAHPFKPKVKDKNGDGIADLVLRYRASELLTNGGLDTTTTSLELNAETPVSPVIGSGPVKVRIDD